MTSMMSRILLSIGTSPALSVVVKATVVLVIATLAMGLARRARASLRHALLASAFVAILALPVLTVLLPAIQVPIARADADESSPVTTLQPLTQSGRAEARLAPRGTTMKLPVSTASLLFLVWALGACLALSPVIVALFRLRHLRRTGMPALDMFPVVNALLGEAGLRRRVDVLLHEDAQVPMTCGIVRPTILLPMDAYRWTAAERQNAFVHELEHIRRSDWLVHLMARVTCSVYWFHPLAWVAWRQMTLDAEHACDDVVVQRADGTVYAQHLVTLAQRLSARTVLPAISMARRRDLTARVSAILNQDQPRGRVGVISKVVIISAAMVTVITVSVLRAVQGSPAIQSGPDTSEPIVPVVAGAKPAFDVTSVRPRNADGPTFLDTPSPNRARRLSTTRYRASSCRRTASSRISS